MDHFYQFAKATNRVPIQEFQEIEVAKENWLMGPVNPVKIQTYAKLRSKEEKYSESEAEQKTLVNIIK